MNPLRVRVCEGCGRDVKTRRLHGIYCERCIGEGEVEQFVRAEIEEQRARMTRDALERAAVERMRASYE